MVNIPLSSVMTSFKACVSSFWTVTLAAPTAADDLSVMEPVTDEEVCAQTIEVKVRMKKARRNMSR